MRCTALCSQLMHATAGRQRTAGALGSRWGLSSDLHTCTLVWYLACSFVIMITAEVHLEMSPNSVVGVIQLHRAKLSRDDPLTPTSTNDNYIISSSRALSPLRVSSFYPYTLTTCMSLRRCATFFCVGGGQVPVCLHAADEWPWVSGSPSSWWCLLTITADILQPTINTTPFRFRSAAGGSLHDSISTRRMGRLPSPAQAFAMPREVRGRLRSNAQTQSIQMQMAHRKRPTYCLRSFETAMLMHEGFLIHVMDALSDWAVILIERFGIIYNIT